MDRKSLWAGLVAGGIVAMAASAVNAQTNITVWDFNQATINTTSPVPTVGTGTASLIGGTTGAQVTGSGFGQPTPDNAWNTTTYPAQGTASGTAGPLFQVSTVGFTACTFSFDVRGSTTPSKYVMPQCSTDHGVTWTNLLGAPYSIAAGSTFYAVPAMTLPVAADNNADVRVRIVSVFDPANNTTYTPVSAAAYAVTGTLRYDRVTFTGTTAVSQNPILSGASVAPTAFCAGSGGSVSVYVNVTPGQNPTSASYTITVDLSQIGGNAAEPLIDLGGGLFGFFVPVSVTGSGTPGTKTLNIHCVDDQNRTADTSTTFGVGDCNGTSNAGVVIAKIYGGGGATVNATPIKEDYVVLYNRTCNPVDITSWSLQYAAATGSSISGVLPLTPASGTLVIQPHKYFLVQLNHAAINVVGTYSFDANTVVRGDSSVITPDFIPTGSPIVAGGTAGVILLSNIATSVGSNFADASIQDMVGYGNASHFEGAGAAAAGSASSEINRKTGGAQDTNQNFNDFDAPASPAPINSADPANSGAPACTCPADLDDGSGTGVPDGGVDINDLLYFLAFYEAGDVAVDLDDGSGTGTPDGGVDINDLLFFLAHYEGGC